MTRPDRIRSVDRSLAFLPLATPVLQRLGRGECARAGSVNEQLIGKRGAEEGS
jgi:hypothetical protein